MRDGYVIDFCDNLLETLPRKTRNTIRRASRELYTREGTLDELYNLHWDSTYLPDRIKDNQRVYVACLEDDMPPISAILVELQGDHLVYRFAGNDRNYIHYNGNSLLLYEVAERYRLKGYKYMDLGGGRIKAIEDFKRRVSNRSYPMKEKSPIYVFYRKIWYHIKKALK